MPPLGEQRSRATTAAPAPTPVPIAAARPDLIRSFAMDCGGLVHPDYVWHDAAQSWQTPEIGEEVVQALTGAPLADRIGIFESFGITGPAAQQMAKAANAEMAASILTLYRSAVQPAMAANTSAGQYRTL